MAGLTGAQRNLWLSPMKTCSVSGIAVCHLVWSLDPATSSQLHRCSPADVLSNVHSSSFVLFEASDQNEQLYGVGRF